MFFSGNSKQKADKNLYNNSSEDFIPITCHYDKHTLLTKNGELVQTIQINGINSEKISKDLFSLREMVRKSIKALDNCSNLAFWIHTIRRKDNLDDNTLYQGVLAANIHDLWRRKNYWHDKFVNRLYISVIYDSPALKLKNLNSVVNSLFPRAIADFEEKYFAKACSDLNHITNQMLHHLESYGAERLGIRMEGEECYSDIMFLYRRIMQLNEDACIVPTSDISIALASHQYAVGGDKIEVIGDQGKKFAAIMSIKEYQEVSAEAIDKFLQIPVEMITTEIFYFVNRDEVVPKFTEQDYILKVSRDEDMLQLKGIDKIIDNSDVNNKFCYQQISFMVMADSIKELDIKVTQASETLAKIGIVHVKEDINLEKVFWAQLPGNFSYLTRMAPTILDNTAALASLHNFPTGNQYSPWGRAITLLRTEKGTPYFMNFHDQSGAGSTCIFGIKRSGKTTLLNFLLSEATKFKPTIVYFSDDLDSGIFVKANDGSWFQRNQEILNPFLVEDNEESREYVLDFFKIIAQHYFAPLQDDEITILKDLVSEIFKLTPEERILSQIIESITNSTQTKDLKNRLKIYLEGGKYYQLFERAEPLEIKQGSITAFSLQDFDDELYSNNNMPKEKNLMEQFEYDLDTQKAVKAGLVLAAQQLLQQLSDNNPKILAIDNMSEILDLRSYAYLIEKISNNMNDVNGVLVCSATIDTLHELNADDVSNDWIGQINTSIILPAELKVTNLDKILSLEPAEFRKLAKLKSASRMFLIRQDNKTIATELSIGGLTGVVKILSASKAERDIYKEVITKYGKNVDEWLEVFYEEINN